MHSLLKKELEETLTREINEAVLKTLDIILKKRIIIDPHIANDMRLRFVNANDGSTKFNYRLPIGTWTHSQTGIFKQFEDLEEGDFSTPQPTFKKGIYARVGKRSGGKDFNIVFEPVLYEANTPIDHSKDVMLNPTSYIAIDGQGNKYSSAASAMALVTDHDHVTSNPTQIVFLKHGFIKEFIKNANGAATVSFDFARESSNKRLTLVTRCLNNDGDAVMSSTSETGIIVMGADDNDYDLLP